MKKVISASLLCFFVILLLFTCSQRKGTEAFEFPNTPWGISDDEVFNLYGITRVDTTLYQETSRSTVFIKNNISRRNGYEQNFKKIGKSVW